MLFCESNRGYNGSLSFSSQRQLSTPAFSGVPLRGARQSQASEGRRPRNAGRGVVLSAWLCTFLPQGTGEATSNFLCRRKMCHMISHFPCCSFLR